jgi:hypothetical protein
MAATDLVKEESLDSLNAALVAAHNTLKNIIGSLASLTTTDKSSVVNAMIELQAEIGAASGATNLSFSRDGSTVTVLSDTGTDAVLPAADGTNAGVMTTAMQLKLAAIEALADVTDAANIGSAINGASSKATPVAADILGIIDSEAGNVLKKMTLTAVATYITGLIVDAAPGTMDTLNEIAAALGDDPNFATTINTALGNRLRVDAAQGLTSPQQAQGRSNLGIVYSTQDFAADFVAGIS